MKQQLVDLITAARAREESDLVPHVDDTPPDAPGRWTAKDQLSHLTAWRQVAAAEIDAVRTASAGPVVPGDDNDANAQIYMRTHADPAAAVRDAAAKSWDQLAAALEACSEADLAKPRLRHAETGENLSQEIAGNSFYHLAEHLVYLHTDRGEEAAAEKAAQWAYEMALSINPSERSKGTASYNLGCFYAARGRTDKAMPLLRKGIELRPELREWANKDSDLDPIRTAPELLSLLA